MDCMYKSTAWIEDHQVRIQIQGEIPAFIEQAQKAMADDNRQGVNQQLNSRQCVDWQEQWERSPRIDLALLMMRLLHAMERFDEALSWCQRIEPLEPSGFIYWQMSELLMQCPSRLSQARAMAQRAVEVEPENIYHLTNLAELECRTGFMERGLQRWETLVTAYPDHEAILSKWLWYKHYSPSSSREFFLEGYQRLAQMMPVVSALPPVTGMADPDRCLNIGFISPDFNHSAAAVSLEAVLDGLTGRNLKLYAYSKSPRRDQVTERLQSKFKSFHDVCGWSADEIAKLIRQDQVDILIEVGGYVRDHGLDVFRYRPAPIQMDYQGIMTTGLPQVDYRVTDPYLDRPEDLGFYTERSVVLHPVQCFCPPQRSPLIGPQPGFAQAQMTFGSFSNHIKITDSTVHLWAQILQAVPRSRMLVKFIQSMDPGIRRAVQDMFVAHGISSDRVNILEPADTYAGHLDLYNQVDLCLDTFPFNGCITTFESLWMGVPVLTRVGQTYVSRMGFGLLSPLDLAIFCAHSDQEYVEKAIAFAQQLDSLATLRQGLRQRLLHSPLCDPQRLGRELDQVFRAMWRKWCKEQ